MALLKYHDILNCANENFRLKKENRHEKIYILDQNGAKKEFLGRKLCFFEMEKEWLHENDKYEKKNEK